MRIGISAPHRASTPRSGVGRYVQGLVGGLLRVDRLNEYVIFTDEPFIDPLPPNARWEIVPPAGAIGRAMWDLSGVRREAERLKLDSMLATKTALPKSTPCRAAATVHDLAFMRLPQHYGRLHRAFWNRVMRRLAESPHHFVCVSHHTAADVVACLGVDPARVHAVPSGIELDRFAPAEPARLGGPYFLFVGNLMPRKNVDGLLRAYEILNRREVSLVLAGSMMMDARLGPGVIHVETLDDAALRAHYSGAIACVFPSFYEGFGFPILEAMACGCPVVTSDRGSMKEVAGDAAILVDPDSPESIADGMRRALDGDRDAWRARGFERVKAFSWDATARGTLKVLTRPA